MEANLTSELTILSPSSCN